VSGFAGIVRIAPSPESDGLDRRAIDRMARTIAFRGPDSLQQSNQPGVSFAFSLLKTGPAPQSGSQPVTADGTAWLIGDVRLDRRSELIAALVQNGQRPGPDVTDEEIVLLAWKLWCEAGVRRILFGEVYGDFSFVLWEPGKKELHCFRDVMGGRPFYYSATDGTFSFSNTLAALHHAPGFTPELDREYVGDFLLHSWCPRPESTAYKSIRRLPAGHWLTFSPNGVQVRRFQNLPIEDPIFLKKESEYVEIYRDLLEKAVAGRLPPGPAAIFLSGGMDSSAIAATVCSLRKKSGVENRLHAVCSDLQPLFNDQEGRWAAKVAGHLGIGFELSHRGDCAPFSGLEDLGDRFPEPLANPFRAIYIDLYRRSSAKSRVVFLGYGGDEILTGQAGAYLLYLTKRGKLARALADVAAYVAASRRLPPLRAGIQSWFRRRLGLADVQPQFPSWLEPSFERELDLRKRWRELQRNEPGVHPVHPLGYRALAGTGWPQFLDVEDAAYTGLPLEVRTPLFDYRLLCFLLRLPALPWCVNKKIVRQAMQGALPQPILHRAKCPLAEDPLLLHAKKGDWRLDQLASPSPELREFVSWSEFLKRGQFKPALSLWTDMNPIALDAWLKAIEKPRPIQ
jgi:asparagine synthase (glutamine-hydrolysing)